jgi:7,8-dihydropterin-6-yl-methyl-4-(beta-D-ribofuranosyl)aminobenzene 5'-phosphate synthase
MKIEEILALVILIIIIISSATGINSSQRHTPDEKAEIEHNNSTVMVKDLNITVIYDNNPYMEGLETSWGFSCLIRGTEKTILFDTGGDGSILLANMEKLGINPKEIDAVVLSHVHGDHVGGLDSFLQENNKVVVYLPKSFPENFKDDVREHGAKVVEIHEPLKIYDAVYSTGELGTFIIEQSLIIHTDKGIIIITGCSHPGIVKIVGEAKDLIKDDVLLVMGGFHLGGESSADIEKIISDFKESGVRYVGPCHCSGDTARQLFEKEFKNNFINAGVGKIITSDDLK